MYPFLVKSNISAATVPSQVLFHPCCFRLARTLENVPACCEARYTEHPYHCN